MKKTTLSLFLAVSGAFSSHAALVLNEPFTYADGALITVSGGVWATHSGTTPGQVDVASGKVNLVQTETEDVNAQLSSGPYSSGNLYASFVVNVSTVPTGSGAYFVHFKDATASGFRGRVFIVGTGAASGMFRVGISSASATPVMISTDLAANTDHTLVMRYDCATAVATLWINPGSEAAGADKAESTDVASALAITSIGLRQGSTSQGNMTLDDLKVGTAFADVISGDSTANPPTISNIEDQSIPANTATSAIPFTINDGETSPSNLVLTKNSGNTTLIPNANIVFGGSGTDRTVTVTPAAGQQGTAEITITVTDENNNSASREFTVTVGAPSISSVANQTTPTNTPSAAIAFTVSDTESAASSLNVTGTSGDENLVPNSNILIGGSGGSRTVTITPALDQVGTTTITLMVSDGDNSASTSFKITVYPMLGLDFEDSFTYTDGSIITNSSFMWNVHSASTGQTGQTQVASGQLLLSGSQSEDIHRFLNRSPYDTNSGVILYSSFKINVSTPPTTAGYFAHFRDTGSGFRAKVFVTPTNAVAGMFRIGISSAANNPTDVPVDLAANVTHTIVTRYNVGTTESTIWVNPFSESSDSVTAADTISPGWIWTYAFRQTGGMGSMAIDDVKIGTTFSEVFTSIPLPPNVSITMSGSDVVLSWTTEDSGYVLQSTDTVSGGWGTAVETPQQSGNTYTVNIPAPSGNKFYRLHKP